MHYAEYAGRSPQFFRLGRPFALEAGGLLSDLTVAYHTYGTLNETRDNVIWVCHALTANSDVAEWWPGTVVEGGLLDPTRYFIVCANKLGSPYGSTSPITPNPATGEPWYLDFPTVTVRDMVRSYQALRQALGIRRIRMIIGGSTGGCQAMEWAIAEPELFDHVALTVTLPKTTPWIVADSEAQRMAIEADPTFRERRIDGGVQGLAAARAMSMLIYRNSVAFNRTQHDSEEKLDAFRASSYQRYQGEKLCRRFNAHCYYRLLQSLDSHDVGRGRGGVEEALRRITARTIVMAVDTDIMFTEPEVREMAEQLGADYHVIHSDYGHDGFLIETPEISRILKRYLAE
ncbi:MAG: homoserine O-acetyltransferase [Rikenella sp.]|nr:homoserine O-acetyltransferase [Rikenella sp.]